MGRGSTRRTALPYVSVAPPGPPQRTYPNDELVIVWREREERLRLVRPGEVYGGNKERNNTSLNIYEKSWRSFHSSSPYVGRSHEWNYPGMVSQGYLLEMVLRGPVRLELDGDPLPAELATAVRDFVLATRDDA